MSLWWCLQVPGRRFTYSQQFHSATVEPADATPPKGAASTVWITRMSSDRSTLRPDEARVEELRKVTSPSQKPSHDSWRQDTFCLFYFLYVLICSGVKHNMTLFFRRLTLFSTCRFLTLRCASSLGERTSSTATRWGPRCHVTDGPGARDVRTLSFTANLPLCSPRLPSPFTLLVCSLTSCAAACAIKRLHLSCKAQYYDVFSFLSCYQLAKPNNITVSVNAKKLSL